MASIDWGRGDLEHSLTVQFVSNKDLKTVTGELKGVTGGSLRLDYYAETRMSCELSSVDEGKHGWNLHDAFRIIHTVSDYTGVLLEETLGTFLADPEDPVSWSWDGDHRTCTWNLVSMLKKYEWQVPSGGWTIKAGSTAKQVISSMLGSVIASHWRIAGNFKDARYSKNSRYEPSSQNNYMHMLSERLNAAGDRLGVDANGYAVAERYYAPSSKGVSMDVDSADPRTLLIGPVDEGVVEMQAPSRVVVIATSNDKTISATAEQSTGNASRGQRGYIYDSVHEESDMSPFTKARAQQLANNYLSSERNPVRSCSFGLMYVPLREGDIIRLHHAGENLRWQVASADLSFDDWTWKITAKGGWS